MRGEGGFISWNWPALFIQFFWSIYRKMWGFALGALALQFAGSFILIVAFLVLSDMLMPGATSAHTDSTARWIGLLGFVLPAMLANGFYHRKVRRLINRRHTSPIRTPACSNSHAEADFERVVVALPWNCLVRNIGIRRYSAH